MFHSAETRWFIEGTVPEAVREWFTANSMAVNEEPRVDEYLVLPGCDTTGVKLRQYPGDDRASFEIKARTSGPVAARFGDAAQGHVDTWVKWSCRPADVASFRDSITAGDDQWVFVEKRRSLRKFSMDSAEPVEVDPSATQLSDGCQFELTSIRASACAADRDIDRDSAETWWSLSFEAFGRPEELQGYVRVVARKMLGSWSLVVLDERSSISYPAWLLRFLPR